MQSLSYLLKVANFNLPNLHLVYLLGVILFEFCRNLWHQKTIVPWLLCGIACVTQHLAISVELVTGKQLYKDNTIALAQHCMVTKNNDNLNLPGTEQSNPKIYAPCTQNLTG